MNKRELLLSAFQPGNAIIRPAQFAGRQQEVSRLVDALYTTGATPIIYGDRGLGKSSLGACRELAPSKQESTTYEPSLVCKLLILSCRLLIPDRLLANQISLIGLGSTELLDELGLSSRILPKESRFVPFTYSCTDDAFNKDEILQRFITTGARFDSQTAMSKVPVSKSTTPSPNLKFYEEQVKTKYGTAAGGKFKKLSIEERFHIVARQVIESTNSRVLFVIDELDRVRDTTGLASVIKNLSSDDTKFLLVGVANTVSALLHDHGSLQRSLVEIPLGKMDDNECRQIVVKTEAYLRFHNVNFDFSEQAVAKIAEHAGGFPWFVHKFGQELLVIADGEGRAYANEADVERVLDKMATRKFSQQYYDLYEKVVRKSRQGDMGARPTRKSPVRLVAGSTEIKVSQIMTRETISIGEDQNVRKVIKIFEESGFHHLLVVKGRVLVGVISDRDLLRTLSPFIGTLSERPQDRATLARRAHQIMTLKLA